MTCVVHYLPIDNMSQSHRYGYEVEDSVLCLWNYGTIGDINWKQIV